MNDNQNARGNKPDTTTRDHDGHSLPEYLTVPELRSLLGIGRSAAYDYASKHGVKIGRLVRVHRSRLPR